MLRTYQCGKNLNNRFDSIKENYAQMTKSGIRSRQMNDVQMYIVLQEKITHTQTRQFEQIKSEH